MVHASLDARSRRRPNGCFNQRVILSGSLNGSRQKTLMKQDSTSNSDGDLVARAPPAMAETSESDAV
jgi:hypothetical protein